MQNRNFPRVIKATKQYSELETMLGHAASVVTLH